MKYFCHKLSDVQSENIGKKTTIWQFAVILKGAKIGDNCNINSHVFIENDVLIGNNVTIKCGNFIWDGVRIEDNVQIGPNVTLTNDKYPRAKNPNFIPSVLTIKYGSSIGGGAILTPGLIIGEFSLIAAGAVVTKNVPPHALVMGNPSRIVAYVDEFGKKIPIETKEFTNKLGNTFNINE
ncbi:acyltransferase [Nonlabens sp.]|uniref:acyltransferase n=1 Tax=Nonlabens sp. TaxID=1888209 RepID=UPI001BCA88EC|nr:acyltransferase [Nonlabens sp.]